MITSFKGILLIFFLFITGGFLIRSYFRNLKVKNATAGLLKAIAKNQISFDEIAAELGMHVRSRKLPPVLNRPDLLRLDTWKGKTYGEKYTIYTVERQGDNELVVIADGIVADFVPSYNGGKETKNVYPCLLHIRFDDVEKKVICSSSMPADKDHQFLLEDLADAALDLVLG